MTINQIIRRQHKHAMQRKLYYSLGWLWLSPTDVVTFFPLDPSHIVAWWAGATLVSQYSLQVVVAAVVGTKVYRKVKENKHNYLNSIYVI